MRMRTMMTMAPHGIFLAFLVLVFFASFASPDAEELELLELLEAWSRPLATSFAILPPFFANLPPFFLDFRPRPPRAQPVSCSAPMRRISTMATGRGRAIAGGERKGGDRRNP